LAESDDAGKRIDHAEAFARRPRHQKPTVVCAEIERCIGRAPPVAAKASIKPPRRPPTPPGARERRPVNSGVEARDVPGLAGHVKTFLPLRWPLFWRVTVVAVYSRSGKVYQRPRFTQPSVPNAILVRPRALLKLA